MTGKWASLVEMLFVYGVVLGLAVWQLVSLRLEIRRDKEAAKREREAGEPRGKDREM